MLERCSRQQPFDSDSKMGANKTDLHFLDTCDNGDNLPTEYTTTAKKQKAEDEGNLDDERGLLDVDAQESANIDIGKIGNSSRQFEDEDDETGGAVYSFASFK